MMSRVKTRKSPQFLKVQMFSNVFSEIVPELYLSLPPLHHVPYKMTSEKKTKKKRLFNQQLENISLRLSTGIEFFKLLENFKKKDLEQEILRQLLSGHIDFDEILLQ